MRTKDDATQLPVVKKEIKQQRPVPYAQNERIMNALNWLYVTFPKLFKKQEKLPLKIGILYDILVWLDDNKDSVGEEVREERPTRTAIRDALTFYTNNKWYQQALVENDKRYDLDGLAVDNVQDVHKTHATERHTKIEDKIKAKNEKWDAYRAKRKVSEEKKINKIVPDDVLLTENISIHSESII